MCDMKSIKLIRWCLPLSHSNSYIGHHHSNLIISFSNIECLSPPLWCLIFITIERLQKLIALLKFLSCFVLFRFNFKILCSLSLILFLSKPNWIENIFRSRLIGANTHILILIKFSKLFRLFSILIIINLLLF